MVGSSARFGPTLPPSHCAFLVSSKSAAILEEMFPFSSRDEAQAEVKLGHLNTSALPLGSEGFRTVCLCLGGADFHPKGREARPEPV